MTVKPTGEKRKAEGLTASLSPVAPHPLPVSTPATTMRVQPHKPRRIALVDVYGFIYRAWFAIKSTHRTPCGTRTNAISGFGKMLKVLLRDINPDAIAIVMDSHGKTFRHEIFEEYKATRKPMDEELAAQIPWIKAMVKALGIPLLIQDGIEADDLLASAATAIAGGGDKAIIVTADKDMMQVVGKSIIIYSPTKQKYIDEQGVVDAMGVKPEQVVDLLALMGDFSDNIPGVPNIGKVMGAKLLQAHGSLNGIYEAVPNMKKGRAKALLEAYKKQAYLSRQLATLRVEEFEADVSKWGLPDATKPELEELYIKLGFITNTKQEAN